MKPRRPEHSPDIDCLREMATHITYEINGFRNGFNRWFQLDSQGESTDPQSLNRAIEAALLHYRTMLEFFRSDPKEVCVNGNFSADIVATDYVVATASGALKEQGAELCEECKGRIDQQLCHISTGRREDNRWKNWPTGRMISAMDELISQFQENLSAESKGWFPLLTNPIQSAVGQVSKGTETVETRPFPVPLSASSASRR